MKKTITFFLAVAMLAISSCTKQGPIGPSGQNGANGSTGATGATGSTGASGAVATELDYNIPASSWTNSGTSGSAGAFTYATYDNSSLSFSAVGSGIVIGYWYSTTVSGSGTWCALPAINYYINGSGVLFTTTFNWYDGGVSFNSFTSNNTFTNFSGAQGVKIVIIPGMPKTSYPVDLNDYNAVKAYFHLK